MPLATPRSTCTRCPSGQDCATVQDAAYDRSVLSLHAARHPRDLGLATATTSATFFPQFEQRIRVASFASVTDLPAMRASASSSMCRPVRHGHVTLQAGASYCLPDFVPTAATHAAPAPAGSARRSPGSAQEDRLA